MKIITTILLWVYLAGCAPLEQAPLLYTSTVTLGASTGVNANETPGFDFVFGYKQVDAAYVPVAVAKDGDGDGDVDSKIYDIVLIQAGSQDKDSRTTSSADEDKQNNQLQGDEEKYDAYSVYGSFDSKTGAFGGTRPGSENALGKVFSTGVAAQTLADAELEKAKLSGVINCLAQLRSLAKEFEDESLVSEATILTCKQPESKQQ